jgi:hypothetical protein
MHPLKHRTSPQLPMGSCQRDLMANTLRRNSKPRVAPKPTMAEASTPENQPKRRRLTQR